MRENVGNFDRSLRAIAGPALMGLGYTRLGGRYGRVPGLMAMIGGAMITETAITRVCPINGMLGIDTTGRQRFGAMRDSKVHGEDARPDMEKTEGMPAAAAYMPGAQPMPTVAPD